jgi:hypothetical protein
VLGILLFGLLAGAAPALAEPPAHETLIPVPTGVIFPASRAAREAVLDRVPPASIESYWTPTPEVIVELESRLAPHLRDRLRLLAVAMPARPAEQHPQLASEARHLRNILGHLPTSVRQYVGFVVGGVKHVYVSGMPKTAHRHAWNAGFVLVEDGGDAHWQAHYVLGETGFIDITWNGEA